MQPLVALLLLEEVPTVHGGPTWGAGLWGSLHGLHSGIWRPGELPIRTQQYSPRTFQKIGQNCWGDLRTCCGHCRSAPALLFPVPRQTSQLLSDKNNKDLSLSDPSLALGQPLPRDPETAKRGRRANPGTKQAQNMPESAFTRDRGTTHLVQLDPRNPFVKGLLSVL